MQYSKMILGVRAKVCGCLMVLAFMVATCVSAMAQTGGEGSIQGTVTDSTGAVIPGASVTATSAATNYATTRTTSADGLYTITPLPPGIYTVTVEAKGFKTYKQENLDVLGLAVLDFSPKLAIGATTETVVVTGAPPVLDTDSAILGTVMENEAYSNLPIIQSTTQQRDPTAFATLVPGAQGGSRTPVVGGTANYNGYIYLDGIPAETINQQGDNRTVALNVSLEAVDQFQVNTSVPPAEYMGAGSMNFTMKSGSLKFHGQVSEFIRNTIFDAWSFSAKAATEKTSTGATISQPKPYEHTNELSASMGGYVPKTAHKVFWFVAYDRYHSRLFDAPNLTTIPSTLMENGDFTEFIANPGSGVSGTTGNTAFLFDPMTNTCTAAGCSRSPFQGTKNGVATNNVIPTGDISPITQKMESFMPNYNNASAANYNPSSVSNNYLSEAVGGRDSHIYDWRVDIDLSPKNRVSSIGAMGQFIYLNNFGSPYLPLPYAVGDYAIIVPKVYDVEDAYTITPHLTNQFKWGYTRFFMPILNPTDTSHGEGQPQWIISAFGVTNLPGNGAQAATEFPGVSFGTSTAAPTGPATWTTNSNSASSQLTIPNNYALVDNLQYLKNRNVFTFGITYQFQGLNNANPATYSGVLSLPFNQSPTASYTQGATGCAAGVQGCSTSIDTSKTGYGYASYLLGAVDPISLPLQNVATIYTRIKAIAPFIEDSIKLNSKTTLDLGLRWDYLPPEHEKFDHFSFLNTSQTNSATGTLGDLQFAGNYGGAGVSCQCTTPLKTYWKNFGPRMGIVYAANSKTVFRIATGIVYSQGGGTGGGRVAGNGGSNGAQQALGFNTTAISPNDTTSGVAAGPSFWLSSNSAYLGANANTSLFGPGYAYPTAPVPGAASQILDTGNYVNSSGAFVTASSMGYEDPYTGGRAPMYTFWNVGFERTITKDMTLQVNYAGDESHHAFDGNSSNARGYWNNQINPAYILALGAINGYANATVATAAQPLLTDPAITKNITLLTAAVPGAPTPAFFVNAANAFPTNSALTIGQMLTAFPQYSSMNDSFTGAYTDNYSYEALQVQLSQRTAHGLTFNINYTYSKNIGDDGTFRNGYPLSAAIVDGHAMSYTQNRIDRSWTSVSLPQLVNAYFVYKLPFGKGNLGGQYFVTRQILGGWQLSGIYTYTSGSAATPTWSTGSNCANGPPNAGQCQMSYNPNFAGDIRRNGSYGSGPNGFNNCNIGVGTGCTAISYVNPAAFANPADLSTATGFHQFLVGNIARSQTDDLRNPGNENFNMSIRRSIALPHETAFVFEADCVDVWNKVAFGGPNTGWGITTGAGSQIPTYVATFGQVTSAGGSGPRDWQLAGHLTF